MKIFLLSISLLSISLFVQSEESIVTEISSVKVFQQGAEINRNFTANINAGSSTLVIQKLSSGINQNSIQVKLSSGTVLQSVKFRMNYLGNTKETDEIRSLKDSIEIMDIAAQQTRARIKSLGQEEEFILSNKKIAGDNTSVDLADLKAISTYARVRISEIGFALIEERKKETQQKNRLEKLRQQLKEVTNQNKTPFGEIVMDLLKEEKGTVDFEVSYISNGASWSPAYDLRSDGIDKPVDLVYKAKVKQNTGVDWKNVNLTISTGNPAISQSRPIMSPWFIDFGRYYSDSEPIRNSVENLALEEVTIRGGRAEKIDYGGVQDYTTLKLNQLNEEFRIALKYDIPSDGKEHTVNMKNFSLPAKYQYHTVPKLRQDAFLLAKVTNWEDKSLLPGYANIFFENTYVGNSYINPNLTVDTLLLSLGTDKRIVVERKNLKDFSSSNFFGNQKKVTRAFEITVRNAKNTYVDIEVLDQIPISNNKEIDVKLEEYSEGKYTLENGRLKWSFQLPPDGSKKLKFVYTVKYPKDENIPGF